ncbi:MAG: hypothetical protein HY701_14050, partial [Gemmatimonadetes bacterium]|nr:hypothetical protein [Gemmatimonadota bacterium]
TCPSVGTGIVGGSRHGAAAQVVLKSPIGDLRNKLLSRPGSRFYDPGHPNAGDTITLQHGHMCGFRACTQTVWERWNDPDGQQRMFGLISSQEINVAGSRNLFDPVSVSDRDYWHTFRPEGFPERTGFKRYVPGAWDWNHDGRPDTLYLDSCGRGGCAVAWSDTLPGGFLNGYGNVGVVNTVGPFRLAAGDTAAYVMAFAVAPEGKDQLERMVKAIQNMYLNFFRGPSAAPVASISSVDVSTTALGRQLSLFLDDTQVTDWVDPFLMEQATALEGSRLAELNSHLLTKIRERARDNVEFVHLLKSCDGGSSFTNDFDCKGDPAEDGKFTDIGWLPYRTWPADDVPSVIEDREVTAGLTYTYVLVSETRGASFEVIEEDATGTLRASRLDLAPKIMNPITVAAEAPQVARVYVPASFQAGSQRAAAVLAAQSGAAKLAPEGFEQLSITPATDAPRSGAYRVLFADQVTVTRTEIYETATLAKLLSVSTRIDARDKRTGQTIFTSQVSGADGITVNGETRSERTVQGNLVFVTSTFDTLTALLVRGTSVPLLASTVLDGEKTTPGTFLGRSDFPGILLNVRHEPGGFEGSSYSLGGERLEPLTSPSVTWRSASARRGATARFGEYVFAWQGDAFGPGAPFVLDFNNPGAVAQAFALSLSSRPVAQTTMAPSAAALALARAAFLARGTRADSTAAGALVQSDIVQASLPFKIRNATFNADVSAIMLKRRANVRRLGSGADTMTVAVPGDAWLPGDELILVESVGGSNAVAWATALLGCDPGSVFRPLGCNPVRGRGASLYVAATRDHALSVRYFVGFSTQSQFTFDVRPAKVGSQITAEEIRAGLDQVNVVPNPYTGFSRIGEQIIFTHLPPRGRLRIYTVAGQFVQELSWGPEDLAQARLGAVSAGQGDLFFDLQTREGNRMASGLYLFVVTALSDDSRELGRKLGKFVIIR